MEEYFIKYTFIENIDSLLHKYFIHMYILYNFCLRWTSTNSLAELDGVLYYEIHLKSEYKTKKNLITKQKQ